MVTLQTPNGYDYYSQETGVRSYRMEAVSCW